MNDAPAADRRPRVFRGVSVPVPPWDEWRSGWHEGKYEDYYRDPPVHTRPLGPPPEVGDYTDADDWLPF